jgi:hypothetical protein
VHASPEPRDQARAVHEIVVLAPDLRDRSAERHRRRHAVQTRRTAA